MNQNTLPLPETGYLRQAQLVGRPGKTQGILPFSAATLWRKVRDKSFPAPVKLSENITAWPVEAVRDWMKSRA